MIPYILHVAILLAGCLAFYKLLLQRETFFRLNRWVLLACLVLAFALPFARVPAQWSLRRAPVAPAPQVTVLADAPAEGYETPPATKPDGTPAVFNPPAGGGVAGAEPSRISTEAAGKRASFWAVFDGERLLRWAFWLYWFGVAAFGCSFLLQAGLLLFRAYTRPVIRDGRYRIIELSGTVAPCSFGNNIFINPGQYDWDTYNQVLEHEKIHCREGHTWDILLAELVLVFQWFNPFAWSYRKTLEHNLEFLTDEQLLARTQVDPASYQMSLLRVSAPHLPLGLTTNYNQSLLKKRVLMMQAKKSNVHTAWKYVFLLPVLALFLCLLNEPAAQAQGRRHTDRPQRHMSTEGSWFATISGERIQMQFRNDSDEHSTNGNSYLLSEFPSLPREASGAFQLKRDAGTMHFTGRFEDNQGMGHYRFEADPSYADFLRQQGLEPGSETDRMVLFFVDASRAFISGVMGEGYKDITRENLIPMAALHIDAAYIRSIKATGLKDISSGELIPFKSLGIDAAYINDIRKAYPNVSAGQLISFKAQGIDSRYIQAVRSSGKGRATRDSGTQVRRDDRRNRTDSDAGNDGTVVNGNDGVSEKVKGKIKETDGDGRPVRDRGTRDRDEEMNTLIGMKAVGVDDAYVESIRAVLPDISLRRLVGFKALGITADYIRSLQQMGVSDVRVSGIEGAKANNVDEAYVRSFETVGYKGLRLNDYVGLKATGVTPQLVKEYQDLGFTNLRPNDVIGARSTGVTPAYIRSMRAKGMTIDNLNKAIGAKTQVD
ncbi:MAG: peptidase M56, BlaR1 [Chitinophagaceae bacterium]|nr:MAG: peptidase M56, BlaR1 [Chitinophagaceae bacterium]